MALLFLFGIKANKKLQLQFLYYYKIVNGNFITIKVDTRFFLNSYLELLLQNQYTYNIFKRTNIDYFINYTNINDIKILHDRFITELFNDDMFQPSGLLTFIETTGGKKFKKTRKLRRIRKKRNTKNMKKKVVSKGTTVKRLQKK